jgi:hypothetical protein
MAGILLLSAFLGAGPAVGLTPKTVDKDEFGTTYWGSYEHAPYPTEGGKYSDSTVAVFVPKHFCSSLIRARKKSGKSRSASLECYSDDTWNSLRKKGYRVERLSRVDYVVHFHGHSNTVEKTFSTHKLRQQFSMSLQNAILVVPQGPVNSVDSDFGKLERPNGLQKLLTEVHEGLKERGVIGKKQKIGMVILTSHSGGYQAAAMSVKHGGIEVQELYLFDSLYAYADVFFEWLADPGHKGRRLIDVYNRKKPTARSKELMAMLKKAGIRYARFNEEDMKKESFERKRLARERILFIRSEAGHSECTREYSAYRDYLFSSGLKRVRSTDWFQRKGLDKLKLH